MRGQAGPSKSHVLHRVYICAQFRDRSDTRCTGHRQVVCDCRSNKLSFRSSEDCRSLSKESAPAPDLQSDRQNTGRPSLMDKLAKKLRWGMEYSSARTDARTP